MKKVQIAADASKKCSDGEFVICARTDARSVEGLDAVIERSKLYIDAGADMIFPEGMIREPYLLRTSPFPFIFQV